MTTYKVYWEDSNGYKGFTYVEVSDKFGKNKAAAARDKFFDLGYTGTITKVVKDS